MREGGKGTTIKSKYNLFFSYLSVFEHSVKVNIGELSLAAYS